MAVATGFQGRTGVVQEPRTGVRRIDLPSTGADAVFADVKAFLFSGEARQMSQSELERELHRRGQQLVRKLLQEHLDQRSRSETVGPAGDASDAECSEPCAHERHTETTPGTMQVVRPGCARRHGQHPLDAALHLRPERDLFEMRRVSIATASRAPPLRPGSHSGTRHHLRRSGDAACGARRRLIDGPVSMPSATGGPQVATGSRGFDAH